MQSARLIFLARAFKNFRPVEDLWDFFYYFNDDQIAAMAPCMYHYGKNFSDTKHFFLIANFYAKDIVLAGRIIWNNEKYIIAQNLRLTRLKPAVYTWSVKLSLAKSII